jgi:RHS repeat-associated protein
LGCNGDHLGNVRLSYTDNNNDGVIQTDGTNSEIIEESNYYPFGLKHKGYNYVRNIGIGNPTAQKFGYNGKELNEELGLEWNDFGARNYDATIGRWMNLDPLAEKYYNLSGYNFTANNPILYIDPNGKEIIISGNTKNAMTQLAQIAATKQGRRRLNNLIGDFYSYKMKGVFFTGSADYDAQGLKGSARTIYYPTSSWRVSSEGGAPGVMYLTGHEVEHANDHYNNRYDESTSGLERRGVRFGNYLRSVYGEKDMRTSYRSERFSNKPNAYNAFKEKVSNFKEVLNFETTSGGTILGFSYDTSTGKKGKTKTEYLISLTTESGKYTYRRFTDKKKYNAALVRLNKLRKK